MNVLTRSYRAVVASAKSFVMRWSGRASWSWGGLARTRYDYAGNVNTSGSSLVMACVLWLARTFPEAPIRVRARDRDGDLTPQPDHPLLTMLQRPNPYYSGELLWMATLADWVLTGNAYWIKVRSGGGRVVELWWAPSSLLEPKYPDDGSRFLDYYEYTPNGVPQRLDPANVVHFRYGLDPANPRKGLSPLASAMREVWTDEEAALFGASLLRNLGVPGFVISPDTDAEPTKEDLEYTKAEVEARFGGDNRGRALVMGGKTKVSVLSFSPDQMNLDLLRRLPEERVTALIGIPAIVVGFGAGLARSTFANYAEAREAAYEGNVIPTQRLLAAEITGQLLPDFGDPARLVLDFDHSQVRVLQPDQDRLYERLDRAVRGGWVTPNEAREKVGMEALSAGGDVLYVPVSAVPTPPDQIGAAPEPVELPEPAPLRALPPPEKGRRRVGAKSSASNLADALGRVRQRSQAPLERDLAALLDAQRARVVAAVSSQEKALRWQDVWDAVGEESALRRVLERWYRRVLGAVHEVTQDALSVSFELDDPGTRQYLQDAGAFIKDISEHTRSDIARALQEGQAAGEGIPQLAARIQEMTAFNRNRATAVARTELGRSANLSAIHSYRSSGLVTHVTVFDGTDDDDACRAANGQTWTLDEAAKNPLQHVNCRRAFGAVVGDVTEAVA